MRGKIICSQTNNRTIKLFCKYSLTRCPWCRYSSSLSCTLGVWQAKIELDFSLDFSAAILVFQINETFGGHVGLLNLWELHSFLMWTLSFVPINLPCMAAGHMSGNALLYRKEASYVYRPECGWSKICLIKGKGCYGNQSFKVKILFKLEY